MNLNRLLVGKINRLAAGGDGSFGRDIGYASTVLGQHIYKSSERKDEFGRKFFRVGSSVVGGNDVVGK